MYWLFQINIICGKLDEEKNNLIVEINKQKKHTHFLSLAVKKSLLRCWLKPKTVISLNH